MTPSLISSSGIHFQLFGFPVTINWFHFLLPAFWLSGVIGQLRPGVSQAGIVAAYVAAVVIGVLGHELGHAFAARSIGAKAEIDLIMFGGLTTWSTGKPITPQQRLRVSLAGPLVGIALGAVSWLIAQSIPEWRIEIFVFLELLTQVALVWGVFNLVPFPGFDGGHSLDAALEIFAPSRAQRIGAVVKGGAAVLGVAAVWYYFGAFSAMILAFFVFRGGNSPLQEYRRSFDQAHQSVLEEAVTLARAGRLDEALTVIDSSRGQPRSRELAEQIEALHVTLLVWTERWTELAEMPEGIIDAQTRALALMFSGRLAQAEAIVRAAAPAPQRDALLAEVLARQNVALAGDDDLSFESVNYVFEHARARVVDAPEVAARLSNFAIDSPELSATNRVAALLILGRPDDARVAAQPLGDSGTWFVDIIIAAVNGADITDLLDRATPPEIVGSAQLLLHQLGAHEASIAAGRKSLELGGDLTIVGFNIACAAVRSGDVGLALDHVAAVVAAGLDVTQLVAAQDLAPLRGTDAFAAALGESGPVGSTS